MRTVTIPRLRCHRCGWVWRPRTPHARLCARCKSPHWDLPKLRVPRRGTGLGIEEVLRPHRTQILRLGRRHRVRTIRVFGSLARHEATASSDVDLLLEFERGASSLARFRFAAELERVLHRRVDSATPENLHWLLRPQILAEAVPL